MNRITLLILLSTMLLCPIKGFAQNESVPPCDTASDTTVKKNFFVSTWQWFSRWRERAQTSGFIPGYVSYPKGRPWLAKLYSDMSMDNCVLHMPSVMDLGYCDAYGTTGFRSKLSAGLYYRGWGLGFGKNLTNHSDAEIALSSYGRVIGFDIKLSLTYALQSSMRWVSPSGSVWVGNPFEGDLRGPEHFIMELNAYYVFNNKKFSYGAALSQTAWQTQSAGSVIAGVGYQGAIINYDSTLFSKLYYADTMELLTSNFLFGAGYAYNWVHDGGKWMIHASILPMARYTNRRVMDIKPMGNMDEGSEESRTYFNQRMDDARRFSEEHMWSLTAIVRLAFFWNISDRWVTGAIATTSGYREGNPKNLNLLVYRWQAYLYGGFRF